MASRDVNSREIAFPGPESQFPGLHRASRFCPSTTYRLPFTGMIRVGSPWGEGKKRGAIAGWSPVLFPADAGTPSIDRRSRWWRARNVAKWLGGYRRSATGDAQWPIGLRTTGQGITVPPLPPPRQMPLDSRSTLREDGRAKWWALARFPAQWRTCQNADMERDGEGDRRPAQGR